MAASGETKGEAIPMTFQKRSLILLSTLTTFTSASALAAGYEKSIFWSGRYAGVAGAASAIANDAQSLYFNPAGLALSRGLQMSGAFTPTFSQFSGPLTNSTIVDGNRGFSPIGGVFLSYQPIERLGIGAGVYVAGGTKSEFKDVDFATADYDTSFTLKPAIKASLQITEVSVGAGYGITEEFRVGLAWRMAMVKAELGSVSYIPASPAGKHLTALDLTDLRTTRYNGFRLGAQYTQREGLWGLGATWRTPISFIAKGNLSAQTEGSAVNTTPTAPVKSTAEAINEFPHQITLGGFMSFMEKRLRLIPEYTWTQYSVNQRLSLNGTFSLPTLGARSLSPIEQGWTNQSNYKLGAEFTLTPTTTLRAGYVLTTQVTPSERARITFASPGKGHTMTLGAGTHFMEGKLELDGALEYSFAKGNGTSTLSTTGTPTVNGEFSTNAMVFHTGVSYRL